MPGTLTSTDLEYAKARLTYLYAHHEISHDAYASLLEDVKLAEMRTARTTRRSNFAGRIRVPAQGRQHS